MIECFVLTFPPFRKLSKAYRARILSMKGVKGIFLRQPFQKYNLVGQPSLHSPNRHNAQRSNQGTRGNPYGRLWSRHRPDDQMTINLHFWGAPPSDTLTSGDILWCTDSYRWDRRLHVDPLRHGFAKTATRMKRQTPNEINI